MTNRHPVRVLITWDVDPDLWQKPHNRHWALNTAMDICHEQHIPATFYITAQPAAFYRAEFAKLAAQGHEVGCHGLTHGTEENYDRMPAARQSLYIQLATHYLTAFLGHPVRAFRSPRVKTSAHTQQILARHGYLSDSTVCSQRLDMISSNLVNLGWLFAPRRPYHPAVDTPYRAGKLPLWQVPVSAVGLPFISAVLHVFGLSMMKRFFQLLHAEAQLTGKPIVYLAHPVEFVPNRRINTRKRVKQNVKLRYFDPRYVRAHGLRARNLLYRVTPDNLLAQTRQLFGYMASFPDVAFMTMSDYVTTHLNGATHD